MSHQRNVYLVDDGSTDRKMISAQLTAFGVETWSFTGGAEFLEMLDHLPPACVLLDLHMPGVGGLNVLAELIRRHVDWPVIALSDRDGLQPAVSAMKLGAIDFLMKPVDQDLLGSALSFGRSLLRRSAELREARLAAEKKVARLTPRERDIALALLDGHSNKRAAFELGISVRTVEMHRAHIMAKLNAKSLADAALLLVQAGVAPTQGDQQRARREEALRSCLFGGSSASVFQMGRRLPGGAPARDPSATRDRVSASGNGNRPRF
jgi:FixJ family two-component response regulator